MPFPTSPRSLVASLRRSAAVAVLALATLGGAAAAQSTAQPPTPSVRGVVRDTAGVPLEGAEVVVGDRHARTGAEGTFRVDGLPPGRYALVVRLVGYVPVRSRIGVVAGGPTELEYYLRPAPQLLPTSVVDAQRRGIFGVVGDTAYRQVVGARVQLMGPRTVEARSDSLGRFAFPDVDPGPYVVRVTQRGYAERRVIVELPRNEGRDLAVLLPQSRTGVTVMDDVAALDLGRRMTTGLRSERLVGRDLERLAVGGCSLAPIIARLGTDPGTTIILNGRIVLGEMRVVDICTFGLDGLELIEFGPDVCAEVSHTIAELLHVSCTGFRTRARPSIDSRGTRGVPGRRSYVVLWEKR